MSVNSSLSAKKKKKKKKNQSELWTNKQPSLKWHLPKVSYTGSLIFSDSSTKESTYWEYSGSQSSWYKEGQWMPGGETLWRRFIG